VSDAAVQHYDGSIVLPDARTVVSDTGVVDCFLCGHHVDVLRAERVTTDIGPDLYMHATCRSGFAPHQIALMYQMAVRGVGRNLGYGVPGRDADLLLRLR